MPIHAVSDHLACHKDVGIGPFVDRVVEINTYNKFLPSLKDKEGFPEELVQGNVPFTELELCNIILTALPFDLSLPFRQPRVLSVFLFALKPSRKILI